MNNIHKKIDSLFSAAISLHDAGENKQALNLLNEILEIEPEYLDAYVLKGVIYQDEDNFDLAESSFRNALEKASKHPEAQQGLGLLLVSQERYEEAIPYLQKHLEEYPDDASSLDGIIKAFMALSDRIDDVLVVMKRAWDHSQDADIGIRYGQFLTISGQKEDAYKVFHHVLDILIRGRYRLLLPRPCWYFDDYDKAIDLLKEAISIEPSYVRAWRLLAECHFLKDENSKALEAVESAIALEPNDFRNWRLKADIFVDNNDYDKALACADKGIDLLKEDKEELDSLSNSLINPFFTKMAILFRLQKVEEALDFAEFVRGLIPKNKHFYLYPSQKLSKLDRPQEALDILNSTADPDLDRLFEPYRYRLLHQMGQAQEAWDYIFPKLQDAPDEKIEFLASVGVEFYKVGDRSTSMTIYDQLLSFQPDNLRLINNYGYILVGEGEIDSAKSLFLRVIEEDDSKVNPFISRCNLAYTYSLQGKFEEAFQLIDDVLSSEFSSEDATLRVPFWFQGEIQKDPAQYPGRSITLEMAALGCGLACALALGDMEKADDFNDRLLVKEFEDPLPLICDGCLHACKPRDEEVIDALRQAFEMSKNEDEKEILKEWVEMVECRNN